MALATLVVDNFGEMAVHDNDTPCAVCKHPMRSHWRRSPSCSECERCKQWVCSESHG